MYSKKLLPIIILIGVILIAIMGYARFVYKKQRPTQPIIQEVSKRPQIQAQNQFNPLQHKIGDIIAGMKILAITAALDSRSLADDNVKVKFSGLATISGIYDYRFSEFSGGGLACFTPDPDEDSKLPKLKQASDYATTFCFDVQEAIKAFGSQYGVYKATITIDHLTLEHAPAEVLNGADLVAVVSKQPITPVK